ncbi:MAG: NAD-dependent epimerase/dehydratase family protein [Woeseiaceae bacterium]
MRIVVTGAGGFVGSRLVKALPDHDVVALDNRPCGIPDLPNTTSIVGDLSDDEVQAAAFANGCDAVVHLATIPGGAAEEDVALARRVNVDATMGLVEAATRACKQPRFVFASSIAVFGEDLAASVDDTTPLSPKLLYGGHKAMIEQWLATCNRRGDIDAISLRVSGVVARPRGPSGMKSAFMSDVFHSISAGEALVMPVSAGATVWLTSVSCAVQNLVHGLTVNLSNASSGRAVNLPALRIRLGDLVDEIARQTNQSTALISYSPDAELQAAFGTLPTLSTPAADRLGFSNDGDLSALVARTLEEIT